MRHAREHEHRERHRHRLARAGRPAPPRGGTGAGRAVGLHLYRRRWRGALDRCGRHDAARARPPRRAAARARPRRCPRAPRAPGPGPTPAGDDFSGGAFFARALLARAGIVDAAAWRAGASAVRTAAARLTHPIGAALLGDLLAGEGWAPLHDLAATLARDDEPAALDAAPRLTRLGHSSGWDLLAGFVAGARA